MTAVGAISPIGIAGETNPVEYRASVLLNAVPPLIAAQASMRAGQQPSAAQHGHVIS